MQKKKVIHCSQTCNVGMALAHDYARLASLICKQNFLRVHPLCVGILFNSTALRIHLGKTLQHYNFKTRLDGEMCSSDVNVHKGYFQR